MPDRTASNDLTGRVALITGAGGAQGRSHALLLAERGAQVIVQDIRDDATEETIRQVRDQGGSARPMVCDVADIPDYTGRIAEAERAVGHIDIIVNNAGISGRRLAFEDIDPETFGHMNAVVVKGTFFGTQAVVPGMKSRGYGKIVNISSGAPLRGMVAASHYSGAKAALHGLTRSWALELAPFGIRVNLVAPGFVVSDMTRANHSEERMRERGRAMPLGRHVEPIDMSYAVAYLASVESDMITGQEIPVNAGFTIVPF
jgi:3-oxoacyl-[acyl-carrier protein] reductase